MVSQFFQTEHGLAFVVDSQLARQLNIKEGTQAELSTDGQNLTLSPIRYVDDATFDQAMNDIHARYDGVFRKLAE